MNRGALRSRVNSRAEIADHSSKALGAAGAAKVHGNVPPAWTSLDIQVHGGRPRQGEVTGNPASDRRAVPMAEDVAGSVREARDSTSSFGS